MNIKYYLFLTCLFISIHIVTAQEIFWSAEQKINTGGHGSNTRPRMLALDQNHGIILWGNEHGKSIHYSLWENDSLSAVYNLDMKGTRAFITSWASTEIAGRNQYVYIVYKEDPAETGKIFLLRSTDYGKSFSHQIIVVNPVGFNSRFPGVAIDKDNQPIVSYMRFKTDWSEPEYVSIRSSDFGETFDPFTEVTDKSKGEACDCCPVGMETDGDRIAIFYRNNRNNIRNMTAAVSLDNGISYPITKELDIADWLLFSCPSTGGDGFFNEDFLYTTWTSARTGMSKVFYSRLNLKTQLVDDFQIMNHTLGKNFQQTYPRMAGNKDTVGIVWAELINSMDILFTYFTEDNSGDLIKNTFRVNKELIGNQASPDLAFSHNTFYLCFQDMNDNSIKFKKGTFNTPTQQTDISKEPVIDIKIVKDGIQFQSKKKLNHWKIHSLEGIMISSGINSYSVIEPLTHHGVYLLSYSINGKEKTVKFIY